MMIADKHYKEKHFKGQNKFTSKTGKNKRGRIQHFIKFGPKNEKITWGNSISVIKYWSHFYLEFSGLMIFPVYFLLENIKMK